MKTFSFTLTRTRLQSAEVKVSARTPHEAEEMIADLIDGAQDSDNLTADGMEFGRWSDGEDEGALEYDGPEGESE
jgi:hypothetical protein